MGTGDLRLAGAYERSSADDVLPLDDEPVDAVRCGEDEAGHWILGSSELEAVGTPHGEVGPLPGLERSDVVATEDAGSAARAERQRLPSRQCGRPAAATRDEERLLHLVQEV